MKKYAVIAVVGVISVEIIIGLSIYFSLGSWADRGTFGDMFGAVNTLFSGLAFCGVIYAIIMQKDELSLQRQELELTRIELKRTADTAAEQSNQYQKEARKTELYKIVKEIDEKISDLTHGDIVFNLVADDGEFQYSLNNTLFDMSFMRYMEVLPEFASTKEVMMKYVETDEGGIDADRVKIVDVVVEIAVYIKLLGSYLDEYGKISESNILSLFYEKKYKHASNRLRELEYDVGEYWPKRKPKSLYPENSDTNDRDK